MRGKPVQAVREALDSGLIPARAGKTLPPCSSTRRPRAHPRACGENQDENVVNLSKSGSSPRVRGKRAVRLSRPDWIGLIPARAGKTALPPVRRCHRPAHPRACGENWQLSSTMTCAAGSSPRVRGKRGAPRDEDGLIGLIPARAGKTAYTALRRTGEVAHPRACGENFPTPFPTIPRVGSSPRVRGKPPWPCAGRPATGLIPARAGKTPECC